MVLYLRPVLLLPGCVIVTCILLALNLFLILPPVQLHLFPVTSGLDLGEWVLCIVSVTCPNNCNLTFSICRCYLVSCTCAVCVFLPLLCFYSFCYLYQEPVSVWKSLVSFTCHLHLCFSVFGASWVCGSQLFLSCTVRVVTCCDGVVFQGFLSVLLSTVRQTLVVWKKLWQDSWGVSVCLVTRSPENSVYVSFNLQPAHRNWIRCRERRRSQIGSHRPYL